MYIASNIIKNRNALNIATRVGEANGKEVADQETANVLWREVRTESLRTLEVLAAHGYPNGEIANVVDEYIPQKRLRYADRLFIPRIVHYERRMSELALFALNVECPLPRDRQVTFEPSKRNNVYLGEDVNLYTYDYPKGRYDDPGSDRLKLFNLDKPFHRVDDMPWGSSFHVLSEQTVQSPEQLQAFTTALRRLQERTIAPELS